MFVFALWASLIAQVVKNLLVMQETHVWSLGWEDLLEKGMAAQSSILAWRIPMDRRAWWATVHRVAESWTQLNDFHFHHFAVSLTDGYFSFWIPLMMMNVLLNETLIVNKEDNSHNTY